MLYRVNAIPLTIEGFKPYGSIISPGEEVTKLGSNYINANQGTAIKLGQVSQIETTSENKVPNWNLFRCFVQPHLKTQFPPKKTIGHSIIVLEKHPESSQTFIPIGQSSEKVTYLIVVALPNRHTSEGSPLLNTLKAFKCKGNQAVTYGRGVWHAPMIAVGTQEYVDFGVLIYETLDPQKPELDCIEVSYVPNEIIINI
ncbi:ureidoglycolate hydrolase NDAI_0F01000 [Naumovozyma dairenensis CBS 421]|uniref:Ureidoglycolate hydrolase n=1 Tax=Naumovozyma dairenensis (strain ATCC 10597 / BCRC 20456 / CBS 421 / NBRC 0211 / NRRL Y-12639) TaxID=1071378 RepID=G0WCA8_NAUDC|nr:hypothetical protein NDAI_0F01000 [Naumovozyma dairenensis CBS 421]CCD25419.1 hypothetical protein NDAI_0F01000 [Naumovozyma dairenensis CBS 421]